MNRENKRKQYEKGYYKHHPCSDHFICRKCGRLVVSAGAGSGHRNHCPNCLTSLHLTGRRTAAGSWSRWRCGSGAGASGP